MTSTFNLRPYQLDAVRSIEERWQEWRKVLLVLPTGCGKTVVFNTIANRRSGNTLILAHRDELIEQARDKYNGMFGYMPGKIKAQENEIRRVTVGSVQTMSRRDYSGMFDTVIVDEAHHAPSPSYKKVLAQFPDAKILGVTATPDRGDKKSLTKVFDGIAYEYGLKDAIKDGYLCPITALTLPLEIDMTNVKISVGDFQVDSIAESLEPYLEQIAAAIQIHARDRKTVVFCPLISIAQELASLIPGAREVNGTSEDRKETLEWFDKAGPGAVLCNAMLLTEGWDCPSCDCVVVLRPTKIRSLYCQMIGRGTRLSPGKRNLLILDFLWMTMRHNLCRPASLICENEDDIKHVTKSSTDEQIDLLGAISDAEEARKTALAEALRRQARKKSKLLDPLEVFNVIDDIELADYEPIFPWELKEVTEGQAALLKTHGIDADGMNRGYASKMIGKLQKRRELGLASVKQVRQLKRFGYENPETWTFEEASKKMSQLAAVGWKRWRLHD